MNLHDCMAYAVSHSTQMRIQAADRSDQRWQRRQAILQAFTPQIDAQTYAYNQYGRNLDPETNTYNDLTTFYNGYQAQASITLFDGFKTVNNVKMAKTVEKMGISQEQQKLDEICLATMMAYYNVIYYSELEAVLEEQVKTAQTNRDKALRQEELGQKGHPDVVRMESELAQKEYQLVDVQNSKKDATITLKDMMFWPAEKELYIDNCVEAPQTSLASTSEIVDIAKASLPEAEIASMNKKKAAYELKIARGSYSPTISFNAGWSTTYYDYPGKEGYKARSFNEQFRNNRGEYLQFSVNIPIYDQLRRQTNVKMKKNAMVRAEAEYEQTMRDIENEVSRAVNDRDGAQAAFRQADKLANMEHEAFLLSAKQLDAGLISTIEYQTASQSYLNAQAERIGALLKLKIKDSVVRYYNGEAYINQ
ncbi:MAG: TolC family protein [Bacteroidales bacterium]|nr:TolC family protein [Bacteroidales bacterium]